MKRVADNQMRWVILLLAIAVILPTVCLLWFMTQAVKNERLAVRQKLVDVYTQRAQYFFNELPNTYFDSLLKRFEALAGAEPSVIYDTFAVKPEGIIRGMLIYDANGSLVYPIIQSDTDYTENKKQKETTNEHELTLIKEAAENTEANKSEVETHGRASLPKSEINPNTEIENQKQTIEFVYKMAYPDKENMGRMPMPQAATLMRYRVLLAELYLQAKDPNLYNHLRRILGKGHYNNEKEDGFLDGPAQTQIWELERLTDIAHKGGLDERLAVEIKYAQDRIARYQNAIEAAYLYPAAESVNNWPDQTIRKFSAKPDLYGLKFKLAGRTILAVSTADKMLQILEAAMQDMQQDGTVEVQIYNNLGERILGKKDKSEKPFLTMPVGRYLAEFKAEVFFKDDSVFANAASRQTDIYIWTGILAIALIVALAMFGGGIIMRQARLNKLKNDFIATISHELRTPLASMRVLVDTLLDGRYKDQQQVREYLELASKENARLSRLIDNFLTFSRMERNKQAFDLVPTDPAEIAKAAAEAFKSKTLSTKPEIRNKFESSNFEIQNKEAAEDTHSTGSGQAAEKNIKCAVTIADGLPSIMADKDAMVTVLVNLLDNAYKYSYDDKQIELNVFSVGWQPSKVDGSATDEPSTSRWSVAATPQKNGRAMICFAVKDNGIGLTRRQMRKIFDKFYQVDSSLARTAEGCGLGLSIVKFIVDAHHGKIEVESKPNKGSRFVMRIPSRNQK